MATHKQVLASQIMVENGGNASKAMRDAGYSNSSSKNPMKLTKSKGFNEIMNNLGLTEEFLIPALVEDIKNKPGNRRAELELAFKLKGYLKSSDKVSIQNNTIKVELDEVYSQTKPGFRTTNIISI